MFNLAYFRDHSNLRFFTLAGVQRATLVGEVISGQFKGSLAELPRDPKSRLLESFVNWPEDPENIIRFTRKYGPLLIGAIPNGTFSFELKEFREAQAYFREIWIDPEKFGDPKPKDGCLRLYAGNATYTATNLYTYFQCVFSLNPPGRIKVCKGEGCPHPYFIAANLKKQCCSAECTEAALRSAKREWWERSGQILRTERREAERKHAAKNLDAGYATNRLKSNKQGVSQRKERASVGAAKTGQM
jgi:hypothetical protein